MVNDDVVMVNDEVVMVNDEVVMVNDEDENHCFSRIEPNSIFSVHKINQTSSFMSVIVKTTSSWS